MLYNFHFFSSKCRLFYNATWFGFCITHILNTGCAKIWREKSVAKRLTTKTYHSWTEEWCRRRPQNTQKSYDSRKCEWAKRLQIFFFSVVWSIIHRQSQKEIVRSRKQSLLVVVYPLLYVIWTLEIFLEDLGLVIVISSSVHCSCAGGVCFAGQTQR